MQETLPQSWSSLTWQQLCQMWAVKQRYGDNADVARSAALLCLMPHPGPTPVGEGVKVSKGNTNPRTGEQQYIITLPNWGGQGVGLTARELAHIAKEALPWFDYPYGDPGEKEQRDEKGTIIREKREGHKGYVNPRGDKMCDAMNLPEEYVIICRGKVVDPCEKRSAFRRLLTSLFGRRFALPQLAMMNITWHQYRSLQPIVQILFQEGNTEEQAEELRAKFLAYMLVPRSPAILDTSDNSVKVRFFWAYTYNAERADRLVDYWRKQPCRELLFYICLQVWQTAMSYYALAFPLLFTPDGKSSQTQDALTAETGTLAAVQRRSRAQSPEAVYALPLPVVFTHLNNMAEEAKQIEDMSRKMKSKR